VANLGVVLSLLLPSFSLAESKPAHLLRVTARDGLLTVALRAAPLHVVLAEIERQTGVSIAVDPAVQGDVTMTFENLPLDDALVRLLRGENFSLEYGRGHEVTQVRVWPRGAAGVSVRGPPDPSPRRRIDDTSAREHPGPDASQPSPTGPALPDTTREAEVARLMTARDPAERKRAVEALQEQGDPQDKPVFLHAIQDADPRVRRSALEALLDLASGSTFDDLPLDQLRDVATHDPDSLVRRSALELLAGIGDGTDDPAAVETIRQAAQDPDPAVRDLATALDRELSRSLPGPRRKPIPERKPTGR
jgi:hypothetical protein